MPSTPLMLVFPAFNSNYKTRKRSFTTCRQCRAKRKRCIITTSDYETSGCDNCREGGFVCDLIKPSKKAPRETNCSKNQVAFDMVAKKTPPPNGTSLVPGPVHFHNPSPEPASIPTPQRSQYAQYLPPPNQFPVLQPLNIPPQRIFPMYPTPQPPALADQCPLSINPVYLFQKYNFFSIQHRVNFKTVPKKFVVAEEKSQDDVIPQFSNKQTIRFLLLIDAFTIDSPSLGIHISKDQVKAIMEVFFYKVNSIFPITHRDTFLSVFDRGIVPLLIVYALVLVVGRDPQVAEILAPSLAKVVGTERPLRSQYHQALMVYLDNLELKIRQLLMVLPHLGDDEPVVRSKVHLLLSLYVGESKYGNEQALQDLTNAINEALLTKMHNQKLHDQLIADGQHTWLTHFKESWWSLYVLDRFHALKHSKPTLIKRGDFDVTKLSGDTPLNRLVELAEHIENVLESMFSNRKLLTPALAEAMIEEEANIYLGGLDANLATASFPKHDDIYANDMVEILTRLSKGTLCLMAYKSVLAPTEPNREVVPARVATTCSNLLVLFENVTREGNIRCLPSIAVIPSLLALALTFVMEGQLQLLATRTRDLAIEQLWLGWQQLLSLFVGWGFICDTVETIRRIIAVATTPKHEPKTSEKMSIERLVTPVAQLSLSQFFEAAFKNASEKVASTELSIDSDELANFVYGDQMVMQAIIRYFTR